MSIPNSNYPFPHPSPHPTTSSFSKVCFCIVSKFSVVFKWAENLNRRFSKEDVTVGQQVQENMLNLTNYQGDANQNQSEI